MTTEEFFNKADAIVSAIFQILEDQIDVKSPADKEMLYNAAKHLAYGASALLQLSAGLMDATGADSAMYQETVKDMQDMISAL